MNKNFGAWPFENNVSILIPSPNMKRFVFDIGISTETFESLIFYPKIKFLLDSMILFFIQC